MTTLKLDTARYLYFPILSFTFFFFLRMKGSHTASVKCPFPVRVN